LRTAKLRMSRKLIYAAGLLTCFSCAIEFDSAPDEAKPLSVHRIVAHLTTLVRKPPLDIIAGFALRFPQLRSSARDLFHAYDRFLALLDDKEKRTRLKELTPEAAPDDEVYKEARALGDQFQSALTSFFFDSSGTPLPELTRKYGVF
jgi:hypothetical protein